MESSDLLQSCLSLDVNAISVKLNVTCDLEVIFLLTNESIVGVGEVESFVGIDTKVWDGPEQGLDVNEVAKSERFTYNSW